MFPIKSIFIGLLILFFIFVFIYWKYDFHKYPKFQIFLTFLNSLTFIFICISIIIQIRQYSENKKNAKIEHYINFFEKLESQIQIDMLKYPSLNYFAEELLNIPHSSQSQDDPLVQRQMCIIILTHASNIIEFITENTASLIEKRFLIILKYYFKSNIFKSNWKYFKENLASNRTKNYIYTKLGY